MLSGRTKYIALLRRAENPSSCRIKFGSREQMDRRKKDDTRPGLVSRTTVSKADDLGERLILQLASRQSLQGVARPVGLEPTTACLEGRRFLFDRWTVGEMPVARFSIALFLACRARRTWHNFGTTSGYLKSGKFIDRTCKRHQQSCLVFYPVCFASRGPQV